METLHSAVAVVAAAAAVVVVAVEEVLGEEQGVQPEPEFF